MRKKFKYLLIFFIPLFIIGCGNDELTNEQPYSAQQVSFLRSANPELTEEESREYPVYYTIDVEGEEISVLGSIGEDFEDYELQDFSESEETVEFTYDYKSVTLEKETDNTYMDEFGNTYQIIER